MNILFVGNFLPKWSSHHPMVGALKAQGHNVIEFDFRAIPLRKIKIKNKIYSNTFKSQFFSFLRNRPDLPFIIKELKYSLFGNLQTNIKLMSIAKKNHFDLVFFAKADTINYRLIPYINRYAKTWFYFMDPLSIAREMDAEKYASRSTWSSSTFSNISSYFIKKGANCFFITQGIDKDLFKKSDILPKKNIDVVFLGTKTKKREEYLNFLIKHNINVSCFGDGWNHPPIYLEQLINTYKSSKIVLNFVKGKTGFSLRVFQVMGCSSFLLSEYCNDLNELFKGKVHLDWFTNSSELLEKIKYYLKNEEIREKIAAEGYRLVMDNYTWDKIMHKIIQIVKLN